MESATLHAPCSRRQSLRIVAGAIGVAMLPGSALGKWESAGATPHRWQGMALGAESSIQLYHPHAGEARKLIADCVGEIERLESLFSLYRPNSELGRLNRTGCLRSPSGDFVRLLNLAKQWHRQTGGAFNIGVQPLWALYARHFAQAHADPSGPAPSDIAHARDLADMDALHVATNAVRFGKKGMALTLNGIAQGYITDRIAVRLKAHGLTHVLVELGEFRATAARPDGSPWTIGIADPDRPWQAMRTLALQKGAVATSGSYGLLFEPNGRHHHLLDPFTGRSANHHRSVTVQAANATMADALSTALSVLPRADGTALLAQFKETSAIFADA